MWWLLLTGLAVASDPAAPEPYATAVKLVDRLFLYPDRVDAGAMLGSAARALEHELPWLRVSMDGDTVKLAHGDGRPIGHVTASSMEALPQALARLAELAAQGQGDHGLDLQLVVLDGMADALDRYSRVLAEERLDRFNVRLTGTLVGIGAQFDWAGDKMLVSELTPKGPADQAGLQRGDEVVRIDGRSTVSMPLSEATRRVRGESGTQVSLTVRRTDRQGTRELNLGLTRAEVVVPNVTWDVLPGGVGYVYIDHVSQQTVENLRAAMAELDAAGAMARGLIIDLRGNTGGSMKESASVADLFLGEGLLLRTRGSDGGRVQNLQAEMFATRDGTEPEIPIVVVVDDRTASGSEILAGALMELDRAAVIGTRTFGKGTVQKVYNLGPDVRFKLTVARYILANEREITDQGILPDVVVGRIALDSTIRYEGWDEAWQQAPWSRIVPEVHIAGPDASGQPQSGNRDLSVEIARRAVLQTSGPRRSEIVANLEREAELAKLEQQQRLLEAYTARGIDWSPAPADGPAVSLPVEVHSERLAPDRWRLYATVTNSDPADLHRVLVQLHCPTAPWWDDVVVPIGRVKAGETLAGKVEVELPPGLEARQDAVVVKLRADRRPPMVVGEQILDSGSSTLPVFRVRASLLPETAETARTGPHGHPIRRARLVVQNLSRTSVEGLEVRFGFPGSEAIELLDHGVRIPQVAPRSEQVVDLTLELGPGLTGTLPLDLVIDTERFGTLAWWPLPLPADGSEVSLQAPQIEARPPMRSAPVGTTSLPVAVSDDRGVSYVVVTVNGEKVAWAPGAPSRVQLTPSFELLPGENVVVVQAEDDQGLRSVKTVTIRGDSSIDAASAE
jgi:C-terminal peptidase prc